MIGETAFRSEEQFDQAEFRRWLDARPASDLNHYELIDGRILMTPPSGWPHGGVEGEIVRRLGTYVKEHQLGIVLGSSTGYDLPSGDTVAPDVSFIGAERLATGPKPRDGQHIEIVPTLVVEILSPSTARRDRTEKKELYARNGVDEYWIVDTKRREITVFPRGSRRRYAAGRNFRPKERVISKVLPELSLLAGDVFDF